MKLLVDRSTKDEEEVMIIKRLTKAVLAPDTALIADQEITELLANDGTYQGDAKQIFDFLMDTLPSGTVDFLAGLLIEAAKTGGILVAPAPTEEKGA